MADRSSNSSMICHSYVCPLAIYSSQCWGTAGFWRTKQNTVSVSPLLNVFHCKSTEPTDVIPHCDIRGIYLATWPVHWLPPVCFRVSLSCYMYSTFTPLWTCVSLLRSFARLLHVPHIHTLMNLHQFVLSEWPPLFGTLHQWQCFCKRRQCVHTLFHPIKMHPMSESFERSTFFRIIV